MTFEEILDQAIAMLQRRGRVTYSTLKRQFQLDDAALEDLKDELIEGQRLAVDERGNVLVWTGDAVAAPPPLPRQRSHGAGTAGLHAPLSGREDPHRPPRPGRRAQAGHRALCRPQGLDGTHPRPRSRSRPAAPRSGHPSHDGRRAPLRGHGQSGARRWHYGPVWRPDCPRRPRPARLLCRPGHAGRDARLLPRRCAAPGAWSCACASASTPGKWWCAPLATTCIWTTRRSGRPRSWRRVWNRWPRRGASG